MEWKETTDINDPLSRRGEYRFNLPWLEHSTNGGAAYCSVRKNLEGLWETCFFHGNMGHTIGEPVVSVEDAKDQCMDHLEKMHKSLGKMLYWDGHGCDCW